MSLTQQLLSDLVVPPIGTCLWWLLSRGTATVIEGAQVSEGTKKMQSKGIFVILAIGYVAMFGVTGYSNFLK
jgi:hypothetical protein